MEEYYDIDYIITDSSLYISMILILILMLYANEVDAYDIGYEDDINDMGIDFMFESRICCNVA